MGKSTRSIATFAAIGLLALGLGPAFAEEVSGDQTKEQAVSETAEAAVQTDTEHVTVPFAGMQIAIDPETGRLRKPTAEEAAKLAAGMRKMFGQPAQKSGQITYHPDGMISAVVAPDLMRYSVLHIEEDGSLTRECVTEPVDTTADAHHNHRSSDEQ